MAFLGNFPPGFVPRDAQRDVIGRIESAVKSGYRNILLCMPTGVGKSHIAMAFARSLGPSFVITAQKILQDQYSRDFAFVNPMKGKPNFPCIDLYDPARIPYETARSDPDYSCSLGRCTYETIDSRGKKRKEKCKHKPSFEDFSVSNKGTDGETVSGPEDKCYYYAQKYRALASSHALFNYASYFQTRLYPQGIEEALERNCLVADEAHEIEDQIIGYVGYDIRRSYLKDLGMGFEEFDTITIDGVIKLLGVLGDEYTKVVRDELVDEKYAQMIRNRREKIDATSYDMKETPENFVVQRHQDPSGEVTHVSIKPIEVGEYVGRFFDAPHQLFMSATINKTMFCRTMSIQPSECELIEVERSPFSAQSRSVVFHNTRKLNYHSTPGDYAAVYQKAREIACAHPDEKGLVLTTTKNQCHEIAGHIGERVKVAHESVEGKREAVLQRHGATRSPDILASPSFWYGVDLKDDLSRFQIIIKAPYPSMADQRTRIKSERDPLWYQYAALVKLLQGLGRSTRSESDHSESHVLDQSAYDLIYRMRKFVPAAYHDILGWPDQQDA